jgi:hypothetical protein
MNASRRALGVRRGELLSEVRPEDARFMVLRADLPQANQREAMPASWRRPLHQGCVSTSTRPFAVLPRS